jgi:hypothetical protein
MSEPILATVITGGFSVLVAMLALLARSNKREHGENGGKLDRIIEATENLKSGHDRIETKIDGHIGDHARGDV